MPKWISKIKDAMRGVLSWFVSGRAADDILRGFDAAAPYLSKALAFVRVAEAVTTNRTLDELVALADRFGVEAVLDPAKTPEQRGEEIGAIVFAALLKEFPDAEGRRLRRAIEAAYGAVKP